MPGRRWKPKTFGPSRSDTPWAFLSLQLLRSAAWRTRSINCVRLLDFLMAEHVAHGGRENGNLCATYDQLEAAGLTRSLIRTAIQEAEGVGLLRVVVPGGRLGGANLPSRYRLTFYPTKDTAPATNEWKISDKRVARELKKDIRDRTHARAKWRSNLKNQKD